MRKTKHGKILEYVLTSTLSDAECQQWNSFMDECEHADLFQTVSWVKMLEQTSRPSVYFFYGHQNGDIKIVAALLVRFALPSKLLNTRWSIVFIPRGPVFSEPEVFSEALPILERLLNPISLKINPSWLYPDASIIEEILQQHGFALAPEQGLHNISLQIDLTQSIDAILSSFRSTTRYEIRRAPKFGLISYFAQTVDDINSFCELQHSVSARKGIPAMKSNYLYKLFNNYLRNKQSGAMILTKYQEQLIGGGVFLRYKNSVLYLYGASDPSHKVPASYHGLWTAINWAKEVGCQIFDLGGSQDPTKDRASLDGVTLFKLGFSEDVIRLLPEYSKICSPMLWKIAQAAINMKATIRNVVCLPARFRRF